MTLTASNSKSFKGDRLSQQQAEALLAKALDEIQAENDSTEGQEETYELTISQCIAAANWFANRLKDRMTFDDSSLQAEEDERQRVIARLYDNDPAWRTKFKLKLYNLLRNTGRITRTPVLCWPIVPPNNGEQDILEEALVAVGIPYKAFPKAFYLNGDVRLASMNIVFDPDESCIASQYSPYSSLGSKSLRQNIFVLSQRQLDAVSTCWVSILTGNYQPQVQKPFHSRHSAFEHSIFASDIHTLRDSLKSDKPDWENTFKRVLKKILEKKYLGNEDAPVLETDRSGPKGILKKVAERVGIPDDLFPRDLSMTFTDNKVLLGDEEVKFGKHVDFGNTRASIRP